MLAKGSQGSIPLRPAVSLSGTPAYSLAKELWRRLKPLVSGSNHAATNVHQLLEKLKDVTREENKAVVTALFNSISLDLAKQIAKGLLQ